MNNQIKKDESNVVQFKPRSITPKFKEPSTFALTQPMQNLLEQDTISFDEILDYLISHNCGLHGDVDNMTLENNRKAYTSHKDIIVSIYNHKKIDEPIVVITEPSHDKALLMLLSETGE